MADITLEQVVKEVQVLRLQPGDVLVLKSTHLATSEDGLVALDLVARCVTKFVGFRVMAVAVPEDATLQVLRSGDGLGTLPRDRVALAALQPVPMQAPGVAYNVIKAHAKCQTCKEDMLPGSTGGFFCKNGHDSRAVGTKDDE